MPPDEIVNNAPATPIVGDGSVNTAPPQTPVVDAPPAAPTEYKADDWRAKLPEDIRGDESLKVFNDPGMLAKSYIHAKKMIGGDKIPVPNKHWTDNDYQQFYDKLGRPALEKYEVKLPKDAKHVNDDLVKDLKPLAHKLGIMPGQVEGLLSWFEERTGKGLELSSSEQAEQTKKEVEQLKTEWGKAFQEKAAYANRLIKEYGGDDLFKWFATSGMGNNVGLVKLLSKAGETLFKEDSIKTEGGGSGMLSPSEAMQKYNNIIMDPKHPYNMPEHPNRMAAVAEVKALFDMAYPSEAS